MRTTLIPILIAKFIAIFIGSLIPVLPQQFRTLKNTGMIERGEKVPKLETFITIANALEVSADLLLADVLSTGYNIKSSEMTDALSDLPSSERERIYSVVNTMITFEKRGKK